MNWRNMSAAPSVIFRFQAVSPRLSRQVGIVRIEREGAFIGHQRLVQMAHLLQRHRQHVEGLGVGVVDLGRAQRQLGRAHDVAAPPALDRAAHQAVRFAPRQCGVDVFVKRLEFRQRPGLRADAGKRLQVRAGVLLLAP